MQKDHKQCHIFLVIKIHTITVNVKNGLGMVYDWKNSNPKNKSYLFAF
jgi:hypothetical protein